MQETLVILLFINVDNMLTNVKEIGDEGNPSSLLFIYVDNMLTNVQEICDVGNPSPIIIHLSRQYVNKCVVNW